MYIIVLFHFIESVVSSKCYTNEFTFVYINKKERPKSI